MFDIDIDIEENVVEDTAAAEYIEKEYYTKREMEELFFHYRSGILKELEPKMKSTSETIYFLVKRVKELESTVKELEAVVGKYLDKEKEKRKLAAEERLMRWNAEHSDEDDDVEGEE